MFLEIYNKLLLLSLMTWCNISYQKWWNTKQEKYWNHPNAKEADDFIIIITDLLLSLLLLFRDTI